MLLVEVQVGLSQIPNAGFGVFAVHKIPKGTVVWVVHTGFDRAYSSEEINKLPEIAKRNFLHYAHKDPRTGKIFLCGDNARFMNHSDNSNLRDVAFDDSEIEKFKLQDTSELASWTDDFSVASRDIESGEEITANYKTSDLWAKEKLGEFYCNN